MPTDLPDDDDFDFEPYLDPVLQAEIDRLQAEFPLPPVLRLPPDLEEIETRVCLVSTPVRIRG